MKRAPRRPAAYVVAVSQREAEDIAAERPDLIHHSHATAAQHLARVVAPPTDSYYAAMYRIYEVKK